MSAPITFHCPACQGVLSVPAEYAGQRGNCPTCQAQVMIPAQTAQTMVAPGPSPGPAPAAPTGARAQAAAGAQVNFSCSGCGHRMQVDARLQGRQGRCPGCQQPVLVPRLAGSQGPSLGVGSGSGPALSAPAAPPAVGAGGQDDLTMFRCPDCGALLKVPAKLAGRQGRCTSCKRTLTIPGSGPRSGAGAAAAAPAAPAAGGGWDQPLGFADGDDAAGGTRAVADEPAPEPEREDGKPRAPQRRKSRLTRKKSAKLSGGRAAPRTGGKRKSKALGRSKGDGDDPYAPPAADGPDRPGKPRRKGGKLSLNEQKRLRSHLDYERHIKAIAFWSYFGGGIYALLGLIMLLALGAGAASSGMGAGLGALLVFFMLAIFGVIAGLQLALGWGLWNYHTWARWVMIVFSVLGILLVLLGMLANLADGDAAEASSGLLGLLFPIIYVAVLLNPAANEIFTDEYREIVAKTRFLSVKWYASPIFTVPMVLFALGMLFALGLVVLAILSGG